MEKIYISAIIIFVITTAIIAKFTYSKFRSETKDKVWKLWDGRTNYWSLVTLCSFFITTGIMLILKYTVFA